MKNRLFLFSLVRHLLLLLPFWAFGQKQQKAPKLVVGIVVDQMRADYLDRFASGFSSKGFNKLIHNGYQYKNMQYNYVPTYTAPGHASIYTGTTPSVHGILANDWYSKDTKTSSYCTQDTRYQIVGEGKTKEGQMSPLKLRTTNFADELEIQTNKKAKTFGISLKDRGAILPAGHMADGAFWLASSGDFISSTFYMQKLPTWLEEFNKQNLTEAYLSKTWNTLNPIESYQQSYPLDNNPFEARNNHGKSNFPYNLDSLSQKKGLDFIKQTPFGNDLLTQLAKKLIVEENLGKDQVTDFLSISYSATDYIGHMYGPRSIEIQDTYLRLDLNLAGLISFLEKTVGKDNFVLFLTADHGAAENPTFLSQNHFPSDFSSSDAIKKSLNEFSTSTFGQSLVEDISNQNVYLSSTDPKTVETFKQELLKREEILRVFDKEDLQKCSVQDQACLKVFMGYDLKQSGDLYYQLKAGYVEGEYTFGTSHGTNYLYDSWVPMLWYGKSIPKGNSYQKVEITSIASTLSHLTGVNLPNGASPIPLLEILD
ncbi:MAG: alkaline phosphatase [Flavobacteriaceae bacterium]|nr:MAG: alkaline phosphatase [Flavobacteriaceae bacterium]